MIQLNRPFTYSEVSKSITGILKVEIDSWVTKKDGKYFTIRDFIIDSEAKRHDIGIRSKFVPNEKLDQLAIAVNSMGVFTGLSETEIEWAKAKLGLLIYVSSDLIDETHTIRGTLPSEWVIEE